MPSVWWPALVVGLVLGFYWARVVKLVLKAKRRGESANFFPPETTGRVIRAIWYPAVVAWVCVPLLLAFFRPAGAIFCSLFDSDVLSWAGALACVVILVLTMICWRKMGREWRMGIDPAEKNNLLVTGPYAYVRHPIYALQQLLAVASAVAVPVPAMVAIAIVEVVLLSWKRSARSNTSRASTARPIGTTCAARDGSSPACASADTRTIRARHARCPTAWP